MHKPIFKPSFDITDIIHNYITRNGDSNSLLSDTSFYHYFQPKFRYKPISKIPYWDEINV